MRQLTIAHLTTILLLGAGTLGAQASDPSSRLKQVLPADVATRVLVVIAKARSHDLPADALENRALKFAAKGVSPDAIEKSVAEQAERMERVNDALQKARGRKPSGDEVEAGAEVMRKGVDGAKVSALAKSAPRDRSLAVPLYVIGSLVDRGLPSDEALKRVEERLKLRASDRDLEAIPVDLPSPAGATHGNKPTERGRELAATKRPGSAAGASGSASGPPANVPGNGGAKARPTPSNRPVTSGKRP